MTPLTITSLDQGRAIGEAAWQKRTAEPHAPDPAPPAGPKRPVLLSWLVWLRWAT